MLSAVRAFHEKHDSRNRGGEELTYRIALMAEELCEISACVTKGRETGHLAEELTRRPARMVCGRVRVSEFCDVD